MTSRRLLILIVAAIVAIAAGVWLAGRQGSSGSTAGTGALYPELKEQLERRQRRAHLQGRRRARRRAEEQGEGWTVSERDNYPADDGKVRKLLIAIADAKVFEEKTSNPETLRDARRRGHQGRRRRRACASSSSVRRSR